MRSDIAMQCLKDILDRDEFYKETCKVYLDCIAEKLEMLEILKQSIYNKEQHIRRLGEPKGESFMMLNASVTGDNIQKVKVWLNDKE